jgi:hypothetical protein
MLRITDSAEEDSIITMAADDPSQLRIHDAQIIVLSPEEQLAFWSALQASPELTEEQRHLGEIMRGEK